MGVGDRASDPSAGREDAPSEEWAELLRAILNAKSAHGTDSEIAQRCRLYFAEAPHLLDAANPDGWTLAYACVWRNRPRTLLCLLDLGASALPPSRNTERTAAQTAHAEGRRLCRKILRMSREDVAKWAKSAELPPNDEHDLPEDKPKKGPKRPSKRSQEMTRMLCSADMLDKQIAKVFMKHDTENDGEISTVELSACFREIGVELEKKEVTMVALQFDADNSGTINRSEFMTMVHQLKLGDKLFERGVRDIFRKFDRDKSGSIDTSEMNQAFKDLYLEIEEDEVEALLLQFDEDGNGQLEEDEFVRMALEAKNGTIQTTEDAEAAGGEWTSAEHGAFVGALREYGEDWRKIAARVKTRSAVQCRAYHLMREKKVGAGVAEDESEAVQGAIAGGKKQAAARSAAQLKRAAEEAERARDGDNERRAQARLQAVHDAVKRAHLKVFGEYFEPIRIASWGLMKFKDKLDEEDRIEETLKFYIRDFKRNNPRVKVDVIKRSQLRTKLGNDFRKYYGRCSRFRAALDKEVLCKSFVEGPLWSAPPCVAKGVCGGLTQAELGKVLREYGGPWRNYERYALGRKDPWGEPWAEGLLEHHLRPFKIADMMAEGEATDLGFVESAEDAQKRQEELYDEDEMETRRKAAIVARSKASVVGRGDDGYLEG